MGAFPIRLGRRTRRARYRSAVPAADARLRLVPAIRSVPVSEVPATPGLAADTVVGIYQTEHRALLRFARAATGDDGAAEDVLQESFVRLIRELAAGRRPANTHAWLFRVATNLIVSQARRARTAERHLAELHPTRLVDSPEHLVLVTERDRAVRAAITHLPLDGRMALLLAAQGFSGREIATALGRTEGATRTLLCRSRLKVRARLESDGGSRPPARHRA